MSFNLQEHLSLRRPHLFLLRTLSCRLWYVSWAGRLGIPRRHGLLAVLGGACCPAPAPVGCPLPSPPAEPLLSSRAGGGARWLPGLAVLSSELHVLDFGAQPFAQTLHTWGRTEVSQVLPAVSLLKLRGQNLTVLPSPVPMCLLMGTKS